LSQTPFHLRPAAAADQAAIKQIIQEMRLNPMGLDWPHFVLAVDEADELVGCGQVKTHWDGSRELASIAVCRQWQRQGVARAIIEHLQAQHGAPLWLTCPSRRIPIYQKFGFCEMTTGRGLPLYFRLVYGMGWMIRPLLRDDNYLAIMAWEGDSSQ
jgi:N-acetylglutamate synthase-like GNAT family acetyltransferase